MNSIPRISELDIDQIKENPKKQNIKDEEFEPLEKFNSLADKHSLINEFARITQFVTWPLFFILFNLLFKIKITGRENLKKVNSPVIIISNHICFYDSFFFRLALGIFSPLLPLRFMAVKKFSKGFLNLLARIGVIDFVYHLFGVFTIVQGAGIEEGLKDAKAIIRAGGNVSIYPEGRMVYEDTVGTFKRGAYVLAQNTNVNILPFSFRFHNTGKIRGNLYINIGEPFKVDTNLSDEDGSAYLRDKVLKLYDII